MPRPYVKKARSYSNASPELAISDVGNGKSVYDADYRPPCETLKRRIVPCETLKRRVGKNPSSL